MCFIITQLFHNQISDIYSVMRQVVALAAGLFYLSHPVTIALNADKTSLRSLRGFRRNSNLSIDRIWRVLFD